MKNFKVENFDVAKFDGILSRGLSNGLGTAGGQVCIEAAICETLGLGHSDDPQCVAASVRTFKIALNDSNWSSPEARAKGLRDLGIAQLGSLGVVDDIEFVKRVAEKTIRQLIPALFRKVFADNPKCLEAADLCEKDGNEAAAWSAASAASAARSEESAASAVWAARSEESAASAVWAAASAVWAARSAARSEESDQYLILSANIALEVLRELNSPGIALLG